MARRKSKAKQEEEFFEALAGLAAISMAGLGFLITKSLYGVVVGVVLGLAIVTLIMRNIGNKRDERLKRSGIADIDKMEGIQFEKYLGHLFRAQGYKCEVTKAAGDYGADLIIQKDGKKIVVQAKRYSKNVGIKAVQEAQASIAHYGASEAWVVSNSDYTAAAYDLAKSNRVKLINREALIEMILAMNPAAVPTPQAIIAEVPADALTCPKCGSKLVLRNGPKGQFYGCSSFPKCRHIKSIKAV
ncbi:restriction endonuclease [Paenibacillus ihuae]|uniref:restriction endonuclease n=1 Tax=Paenibacillus ihuae TaxID=1232431 RepID=UPI0006D5AA17|nr:restriction endonuclease [Paenibacillus ihuae]